MLDILPLYVKAVPVLKAQCGKTKCGPYSELENSIAGIVFAIVIFAIVIIIDILILSIFIFFTLLMESSKFFVA